jgi:hypothetical protein
MNAIEVWKNHEKGEHLFSYETGNGFEYENGDTLLWNEDMYQKIKSNFSECEYTFSYTYYNKKQKSYYYYLDFLYEKKELRIEIMEVKQGYVLHLEPHILCFNERWNNLSDQELFVILEKIKCIKNYLCSLPKYRVKHVINNIIKKKYSHSFENEMKKRNIVF